MKKINLLCAISMVTLSLTACDQAHPLPDKTSDKPKIAHSEPETQKNEIVVELTSTNPRSIDWFATRCQQIHKWAKISEELAHEALMPTSYQLVTKSTQESLENLIMTMTIEYNLESDRIEDKESFSKEKAPSKIDNPHSLTCLAKAKKTQNTQPKIVAKPKTNPTPTPTKDYDWFLKECTAIEDRRDEIYDVARNVSGTIHYDALQEVQNIYGKELVKRARKYNSETKRAKKVTPEIFNESSLETHITNAWELQCVPE